MSFVNIERFNLDKMVKKMRRKHMRKYLVEKMMDVLAEKYEHLDIMEVYLNDAGQKCIRFLIHTYSTDGGYDFNAEWNEDFGYRIVYHSHQVEITLQDYILGISENSFPDIFPDIAENQSIDDIMLEDDRQYIQDCNKESFANTLTEYIISNDVMVYPFKMAISENISVGKYMFLLDISTNALISKMINKLELDPSKKDEYVSELLTKIN